MSKVYAVCSGEIVALDQVDDVVFSSGMAGDGIAIRTEDEWITAPCDGEILSIFPDGHAFAFRTRGDSELLIHIGVDAVILQEKAFDVLLQPQVVKKGTPVIRVNWPVLAKNGMEPLVLMIHCEKAVYHRQTGSVVGGSSCVFETTEEQQEVSAC